MRTTSLINMAVNNSLANAHRKKGRKPIPLWQKETKIDKEAARDGMRIIQEMSKRTGNAWVRKLWAGRRKGRDK